MEDACNGIKDESERIMISLCVTQWQYSKTFQDKHILESTGRIAENNMQANKG